MLSSKIDVLRTDLIRYAYLANAGTLEVGNTGFVANTISLYPVDNSNFAFTSTTASTSFSDNGAGDTRTYTLPAGYYAIAISPPSPTPGTPTVTFQSDPYACPTEIGSNADDYGIFEACYSATTTY